LLQLLVLLGTFFTTFQVAEASSVFDLRELTWESAWTTSEDDLPTWQPLQSLTDVPAKTKHENILQYRFYLPGDFPNQPGFALLLQKVRYQFEVFLAGKSIYKFGPLDPENVRKFYGLPVHLIELPLLTGMSLDREIVIKVYSPEPRVGLSGYSLAGPTPDLQRRVFISDIPDLLISGFLIFLGLISLLFFVKSGQFKVYADFSLVCLFYGLFVFFGTEFKCFTTFDPFYSDNIQAMCAFATPLFWLRFFRHLFPNRKFSYLVVAEYAAMSALMLLPVLSMTGVFELVFSMPVFQIIVLFILITYLTALVSLANERIVVARHLLFGISIVGLATLNDILMDQQIIHSIKLGGFAIVIYILQFGMLASNYLKKEYQATAAIQRDLEIASVVQNSFLQSKKLSILGNELVITYRSASEVGGDWYHYKLIEGRYLNLHIADITGHGPQAALGACYIKGIVDTFYQLRKVDKDLPGKTLVDLHEHINRNIYRNTGESTGLTFLSLVVDLEMQRFCYLNSGHLPPFVLDTKTTKASQYSKRQNNILGVTEEINFLEQKEWIALPDQALILIHTDGLYELEPLASTYGGFKKSLSFLEIRTDHSQVAIHESVEALVNLQHGKTLSDYVTVITLQLL
jgi:serine phosphatase RsbU (regulator of sigma subunit)